MKPSEDMLIEARTVAQLFIKINRELSWANIGEEMYPAAQVVQEFLDALEQAIKRTDPFSNWSERDQALIFAILMTVLAEAGQYRHEGYGPNPSLESDLKLRQTIEKDYMPLMNRVRRRAAATAITYLKNPIFESISEYIDGEVIPLINDMTLDCAPDRFMPFRVIHVGNVVERLYGFRVRTQDPRLTGDSQNVGLLKSIYRFKYLRFGTSGVRGLWGRDFTEERAKQVVQAICDFMNKKEVPSYVGAEDLRGRRVIVGYDSRLNALRVAEWAASVCLANGFSIDLANRDTPTPALVYYLADYLPEGEAAGLINLTASHNPPEWQGIKFNPRQGWPAPTNVTDFIASRINEINLLGSPVPSADVQEAVEQGKVRGFDPIDHYIHWVFDSGKGNDRISLDSQRIRDYFFGEKVVVDEMHGASRGYLTRALGEIGVQHTVIHAERNPLIPGLDYANPEEPFINQLKEKVRESGAKLGMGMDTDADRYGVVDRGGIYLRPNQILPMLVMYLGIERGIKGRVIATQTGSPLLEVLAGNIGGNAAYKPDVNVIPAYVDHMFYRRRVGKRENQVYQNTFMVPVGIKYIEEQRRTDRRYKNLSPLPDDWRYTILIGGEESSGLTTKGHVTDKDGVWANLLIMDMLAYYGTRIEKPLKSLAEIWEETTSLPGCWKSYGGRESQGSNAGRSDVDAVLEVKEDLINYYLDCFAEGKANRLADLDVIYAGGVRYDLVELRLRDGSQDDRHFLRIRASGTEPINRIYVESSDPETAQRMMQNILGKLVDLTVDRVKHAPSEWYLAEMLSVTSYSDQVLHAVNDVLSSSMRWTRQSLAEKLEVMVSTPGFLESRNCRITRRWIEAL